jgi:MIP family channel proteins
MFGTLSSVFKSTVVNVKALVAEFVGMALFVTVATGTAVGLSSLSVDSNGEYDAGVHAVGTAMAFGFTITSLAYATGHTSGGQFNPAVTMGLVASGRLPAIQGALNIVSQVSGAIVGSTILYFMYPGGGEHSSLGSNELSPAMSAGQAFLGEMIATFALVFVVLETACNSQSKDVRTMAPLAIGYTVFVAHLLLIPFTSCSINPARSFGPAIVSGTWGEDFWVFIVGPTVGGLAAAPVHLFLEHFQKNERSA